MKKLIITSVLAVLVAAVTTVMAQDYPEEYLGLPGDNLNLFAVMKLFQESETLEGFERSLNDENSKINNLDLNGDNYVDYITVSDYVDGDVHTIVLRAVLDRNEYQDVAVFTVQKYSDNSVQIQLVGDEALYGNNYIIEPYYAETPNPGYTGKPTTINVTVIRTTPYEVATWPVIRYIYMPRYVVWHSSWYWGYYPRYWRPWRPFYWHYYYGYHYHWYHHYYRHYRYWPHYRHVHYNNYYYTSIRVISPTVIVNVKDGRYRSTYARPEQRRDGEALYTKMYPSRERRTADDNILARQVNQERKSAAQEAVTTRRSSGTASERSAIQPSQTQRTEAARRSTFTNTERVVKSTDQPKRETTTQRSATTVTRSTTTSTGNRSTSTVNSRTVNSRSSQATQSQSTRRSEPAASARSSSRSESSKSASSSRTSRSSSGNVSRSSSGSRSNKATRSSGNSSSGRSSSSREKDDSKSSSRRR